MGPKLKNEGCDKDGEGVCMDTIRAETEGIEKSVVFTAEVVML
jgi:hypothetical protein